MIRKGGMLGTGGGGVRNKQPHGANGLPRLSVLWVTCCVGGVPEVAARLGS